MIATTGKPKPGWKECRLADTPLEIIDRDKGTNYPKQGEFNQNGYCLFLNAKNVTADGFAFDDCGCGEEQLAGIKGMRKELVRQIGDFKKTSKSIK